MATLPTNDYINGSDLLLYVGGKPVGHCSTHTLTFNSETKDRAVKPEATKGISAGLWKAKGVTGLSISISAEGLRFYNETENGYEQFAPLWGKGKSVTVEAYRRTNEGLKGTSTETDKDANAYVAGDTEALKGDPYLKGKFVITSLEEVSPAQDDATYSISLENDGEPDQYPGKETTKQDSEQS